MDNGNEEYELPSRRRTRPRGLVAAAIAGTVAIGLAIVAAPAVGFADPGVSPSAVAGSLKPGEPYELTKTVSTIADFPPADVYFLADTTGSMSGTINNVQANTASIMTQVAAQIPNSQFGAGDYKDFPFDPYVFRNGAPVGTQAATQTVINTWFASGGADTPEGQFDALHRLSTEAGWRAGAAHILVWFGDAAGHDPICSALSGLPTDITETSVLQDLVANRIRVLAISVTSGGDLNSDPRSGATDYTPPCTVGGAAGQATRIAAATLGTSFNNVPPAQVAATIIAGLRDLQVIVTPQAACDPGVTVDSTRPTRRWYAAVRSPSPSGSRWPARRLAVPGTAR